MYAVSSRLIRIRETPGKVPGNVLLAGWRLLPTSRLIRTDREFSTDQHLNPASKTVLPARAAFASSGHSTEMAVFIL